MRTPRRQRTGTRRDDLVRRISADEVRYPGHDLPPLPDDPASSAPSSADGTRASRTGDQAAASGKLAPARDAGIAVEGRAARMQRARERSQQRVVAVAVMALAGLLLLAIGWQAVSDRPAPSAPLGGSAASSVVSAAIGGSVSAATAYSAVATPTAFLAVHHYPTPIFARYKTLLLRLPVPIKALTEVGFHQASYGYALPMKTSLPDANLTKTRRKQSTGRNIAKQPTGPDAVLIGSVVRMWRSRPGKPDTAADVGAKAGTVIIAPVSGTIIKIKPYKLYGKYDDYEIHIQPTGHPKLDVVLIHIKGIECTIGEQVKGGITHIAHIRMFSDKFHDQLADYSKGPGDHVHMEVNDTTDPTYKGLEGAIDPLNWHGSDTVEPAPAAGATTANVTH